MVRKTAYLFVPVAVIIASSVLYFDVAEIGLNSERDCGELNRGTTSIRVGSRLVVVEVSDNDRERVCGLSYRESLGRDEGMLFVFDGIGVHGIWMKGMHFPIDVLWLDDEGRVVHIERAVAPESYPNTFSSPGSRYVLELPAGTAAAEKISLGESLLNQTSE